MIEDPKEQGVDETPEEVTAAPAMAGEEAARKEASDAEDGAVAETADDADAANDAVAADAGDDDVAETADDADAADDAVAADAGDDDVAETADGADAANDDVATDDAKTTAGAKAAAGKKATGGAKATGSAKAADDDGAVAGTAEESGLPTKWYVIHTYSGHENKVKENIQKMVAQSPISDHFGKLIVPTEEVAEMKKGKKTITTRKFFPSYILIEMHMTDESWHLVNSIPGVTSFVGSSQGAKPQPLLPNEVERILGRMDKERETISPEIPYTLGEHIRIKDGPFSDFTGVVDEINAEKGKLRVLVSIFGRETPVELDFLQVESI
jgi:transcriptional antiterminator NusG